MIHSLIAVLALSLQGGAQLPDTVAGKRAAAVIAAVNTKDLGHLKDAIQQNFAASVLKDRPAEARAQRMIRFADDMAPVQVVEVLDERPGVLVVRIKGKMDVDLGIRFDLEPEPPHGIVGLRIGPPEDLRDLKPAKTYTTWKTLDELAGEVAKDNEAPAMVVGLGRIGQPVQVGVAGLRMVGRDDPATRDDLWLIGSIGKSFTSTLVAKLIEEGKLDWDSQLGTLLPDLPLLPAYREVTVEQLMQHRGGIPQALNFTMADVAQVSGRLTEPQDIRDAYLRRLFREEPIGKAGEKFAYSNGGYAILSHLAERAEGMPYERLVMERLFKPLGMAHSKVGVPGDEGMPGSLGQPSGHAARRGSLQPMTMRDFRLPAMMVGAGGGVACTIEDLVRFGMAHLEGLQGKDGYLKAATIKRLHTPRWAKPGEEPYSSGWSTNNDAPPGPAEWHNGGDGTMRADLAVYVQQGIVVAAIINRGGETEPSPCLQAVRSIAVRG